MRLSELFLKEYSAKPMSLFIETGTGTGYGLRVASKLFDRCLSIEQDRGYFEAAAKEFKAVENVALYWNSSPAFLNSWPMGNSATTFWLDAHYSGVGAANECECPLLGELSAIAKVNWKIKPVILIDDAYYFSDSFWLTSKSKPYTRDKWPTRYAIQEIGKDIAGGLKLEGFKVRGRDKVLILR